jgi:catechol 2,3-dioxygenase-like lactoylglutathione lyase family enzyme
MPTRGVEMSTLASVAAVTLFAEDPKRSKEFYGRAFEREPVYEDDAAVTFRLDNVLVNVLRREEAPELVEPAAVAAAGAGPGVLLTLSVEDVDAAVEQLGARGVEFLNGPLDRPWGVRTACFADPDGHAWELAGPPRG